MPERANGFGTMLGANVVAGRSIPAFADVSEATVYLAFPHKAALLDPNRAAGG